MQATIVNQIIDYSQISNKKYELISNGSNSSSSYLKEDNIVNQNKNFDNMVRDSATEKQKESESTKDSNFIQSDFDTSENQSDGNPEQTSISGKTTDNEQKKDVFNKTKKNEINENNKFSKKSINSKNLSSEHDIASKTEKQNILNESIINTSKIVSNSVVDKKDNNSELSEKNKIKISANKEKEVDLSDFSEDKIISLVQEKSLNSDLSSVSSRLNSSDKLDDNEIGLNSFKKKTYSLDKDGKITISDYRTNDIKDKEMIDSDEKKSELKISNVKFTKDNSAEITMDLSSVENTQANVLSTNNQSAGANGSNFQAMLSNQIQQNAQEFVKTGNIILKDNDIGQIKLILNPESLGNVKIDLQISDKNITGRIVVASQEAYNAFKESADTLKQAFINSGFETAGFDLSFAGQDASSNQFAQNRNDDAQIKMTKVYGDYTTDVYSENDEINENIQISSKNAVNIVA